MSDEQNLELDNAWESGGIPLQMQIECVKREIRMRESVYARRVATGKMRQSTADWEVGCMRAVLNTLEHVVNVQPRVFRPDPVEPEPEPEPAPQDDLFADDTYPFMPPEDK